jgi:hypothetical protein
MKKVTLFILLIALQLTASAVNAIRYYTCDNVANPAGKIKDEMGGYDLTPVGTFNIVTGGAIGKGVEFTKLTDQVAASTTQLFTASFTFEFLWKPGHYIDNGYFAYTYDNAFVCGITCLPHNNYAVPELTFQTQTGSPNQNRTLTVQLDGIGRKSLGWFMDGNYHHMVFKYNSTTGLKQIFVDGECPAGFSETVPTGNLNTFDSNHSFWFNSTVNYVKYYGYYDNIAIYDVAVSENQIYQHYLDFRAGINYSFTSNAGTAPTSQITSGLQIKDYINGTSLSAGQTVTPCVSCATPLNQLKDYPAPRYHIAAPMLKNFQWFDPEYVAGKGTDGQNATTVATYVAIQKELYMNWNYYAMANLNVQNPNYNNYTTEFQPAGAKLCADSSKWQCSAITFRLQGTGAQIWNTGLSADHYLNNGTVNVNLNCSNDGSKYWSPAANTSDYEQDGIDMKAQLQALGNAIKPNKLKIINENAEYLPVIPPSTLLCDPTITRGITQSGLTPFKYLGRRAYDVSSVSYRDIFMRLPDLKGTWYTEYSVDGKVDPNDGMDYRIDYAGMRLSNTPIKGFRYATPDIYFLVAKNWRNWISAWHGWEWVVQCRGYEKSFGDKFYSPFICAGFDKVEENTMRPAQFLGMTKILAASGAEFFYSGYFTLSVPYNDPKNWAWQISTPSYVQAITSRYYDCFKNGDVMDGDAPRTWTNDPLKPGFSFYTGDPRKLCVVRKHNSKNKFVIVASINPVTNDSAQTEDESAATIYLNTDTITFNVRRQGSVYVYDKTGTPAVFYQVDGWHENSHPSRWTKDFLIEAENWDNSDDSVRFRVTTGNTGKNYTSYLTTAGVIANKYPLRYDFQPRGSANQNFYLWVKAAKSTAGTVRLRITIDNLNTQYIDVSGTTQTWYRVRTTGGNLTFSNVTPVKHSIRIYQEGVGMRVDKIAVTADPAKTFSN